MLAQTKSTCFEPNFDLAVSYAGSSRSQVNQDSLPPNWDRASGFARLVEVLVDARFTISLAIRGYVVHVAVPSLQDHFSTSEVKTSSDRAPGPGD